VTARPAPDREAAVRRNTALLMVAEPMNRAILTLAFTVGVVAVVDFSGRDLYAGLYTATHAALTAAGAFLVGRAMDRRGRRPGLVFGYGGMVLGSGLAAVAFGARSAGLLVGATAVLGFSSGAANLGRAAAADMHPPQRRGRAVGRLLAVGTVGAVGGPLLAGLIDRVSGGETSALPWAVTAVLALVALGACLFLRPDPRDLAVVSGVQAEPAERRPIRALMVLSPFRASVVAIGIAQASMVAVMGVTPVEISHHGGSKLAVGATVSLHVAGMFAFSPLVGAALDRWGRRPGLLAGAVVTASGAVVTAIANGSTPVLATGLFFVGLGWSAVYLASTAVISDVTHATERAGALGFVDLVAALSAAVGALAGGFALDAVGFAWVGAAVAALIVPVLVLVVPLREPAPGRWAAVPAG
jgi:MFS family permease